MFFDVVDLNRCFAAIIIDDPKHL